MSPQRFLLLQVTLLPCTHIISLIYNKAGHCRIRANKTHRSIKGHPSCCCTKETKIKATKEAQGIPLLLFFCFFVSLFLCFFVSLFFCSLFLFFCFFCSFVSLFLCSSFHHITISPYHITSPYHYRITIISSIVVL